MGSIVALDQFRQEREQEARRSERPERPAIVGAEIWGRDYTDIEAIVFGLLKVRTILAHHMGGHDRVFDALCMVSLEAAYGIGTVGPAKLKEAIKPLKEWILDEMTEDNKRDLSWSLVILDLIEKSPSR